jgi:thiamine biosynthesis lipoprotein
MRAAEPLTTGRLARESARVMGGSASVVVHAGAASPVADVLARCAIRRLHDLERRWSRFLPDSEVTLVNLSAGRRVRVSTDTLELVAALVGGWRATAGDFDPTLLGAIVELGYDVSCVDDTARTRLCAGTTLRGEPGGILVDPGVCAVKLPDGTALDPGGIGKGLAADIVVRETLAAGATGALVEVGGDVAVGGAIDDHIGAWRIAIADQGSPGDVIAHVELSAGGVATSGTSKRSWRAPDGSVHHHLLDPRTGRPCTTPVTSCTVIAGGAAWAEAFTKVAFVHGAEAAVDRFDRHGLAGLVTTADGAVLTSQSWKAFER